MAREDRRRPLVVTGTYFGIPGARIGGAVVDEIELGIVCDPAPGAAAADLPLIRGPRRDPEILALIHLVKRLEGGRVDENILIRAGVICGPGNLSRALIERLDPTADAEL